MLLHLSIFACVAVLVTCYALPVGAADVSARPGASVAKTDPACVQHWQAMRFGMFIHWGPVSLVGKELSWSRGGAKPLDITGNPAGAVEDPVYDNLYKRFDPAQYDARQWVKIAQDAGMKYMVLTCKHHDGFCLWDTKLSEHKITNTPFKRDVVKELADACHEAGMGFGVYYSPRDWHHPDYGVADNRKYVDYMNGQLRELLTNYGKVDIVWFDSYGHGDLMNFWHIDETWSLIKQLQPQAVVNNRLAVLADYNRQPEPFRGDFDTPEQTIGRMQVNRPWESCMCLVGHQWSYKPDGEMDSFQQLIDNLVSCAAGDGNLLLDVGPMPTGQIEPRQVDRLNEVGDWLKKYGQTVYSTRGGPMRNGSWGGTTCRVNTVYVHVLNWPRGGDTLRLNPIDEKIVAAVCLTGGEAKVVQTEKGIDISLAGQRDPIDTIFALTLDRAVTHVYDADAQRSIFEDGAYGKLLSENATFTASSASPGNDKPADHASLFTGKNNGYAFHTENEPNPWIVIDLRKSATVCGVRITNRPNDNRATGLELSLSEDGQTWTPELWKAEHFDNVWDVPVVQTVAGAAVPGRPGRYIKLELHRRGNGPLLLKQVEVFGRQ